MNTNKSIVNFRKMNAKQAALVAEIDAHMKATYADYDATEKLVSRQQLREAHGALRKNADGTPRAASPFFISHNVQCKVKGYRGLYSLKCFFQGKKVAPPVTVETTAEAN